MKEKRMGVTMVGCVSLEMGVGGGKMRKKRDVNWKKKKRQAGANKHES